VAEVDRTVVKGQGVTNRKGDDGGEVVNANRQRPAPEFARRQGNDAAPDV
jgi:hypothetical protein